MQQPTISSQKWSLLIWTEIVKLLQKITSEYLQIILSISAPNNLIQYYINFRDYPDLQKYFALDELSGDLTVNLFDDNVLDRDSGVDEHVIRIIFEDNFQGSGGEKLKKTVC